MQWALTGVGADGRSLRLAALAGGCVGAPVTARARETPSAIAPIVRATFVRASFVRPHHEPVCTLELHLISVTARLAAPIAGRRIIGLRPRDQQAYRGDWVTPGASAAPPVTRTTGDVVTIIHPGTTPDVAPLLRIPNVVGLSAVDATTVLTSTGAHMRLIGRGHQVIAESPAPGTLWNEHLRRSG